MLKIQDLINNRNKYKVDYNYQRPNDAWSNDDKQCLIDTILKDEPMPLFFFNFITNDNLFYIVDGQQRMNCIIQFYNNEIKSNKKHSGINHHGRTFNGDNGLNGAQMSQFLNYQLKTYVMEDYDDEKVRLIFSRLQRGKPLQLGERLNAKPGKIVESMRAIANHDFLKYSVGVTKKRYGVFPDAARILFYEIHGAKQMGSKEIYDFFELHKEIDTKTKTYRSIQNVLNYLLICFPKEPGDYKFLEKHAWVLAVYSMVRELKLRYALVNQEIKINTFIKEFHSKIYNENLRASNTTYQKFYDNIRGGWSEKIISLRRDILMTEFLKKNALIELDDRRQISNEEKITAFGLTKGKCKTCNILFKDYKEAEYHHEELYSEGGKSELSNIIVLCTKCHDLKHSTGKVQQHIEEHPKRIKGSNNITNLEDLPIGKLVKQSFKRLIESDLINEKEVEKLQTEYYSKMTFDIQYPFLKKVNSANFNKVERYWKSTYLIKGNWYLICSEWYEQPTNNDKPYYLSWLKGMKNKK